MSASGPKASGVYAIRRRSTGQVYVGSSLNIHHRWIGHRAQLRKGTHPCLALQRDWTGEPDEFDWLVLEMCAAGDLVDRETQWILKLNAISAGYNVIPGAPSSPEFLRAARARRRPGNQYTFAKTPEGYEAARAAASESRRQFLKDHPEFIEAHSERVEAWWQSADAAKLRESRASPCFREKCREVALDRPAPSPEARAKMSSSAKADRARKRAAGTLNQWERSPETIEKMRAVALAQAAREKAEGRRVIGPGQREKMRQAALRNAAAKREARYATG